MTFHLRKWKFPVSWSLGSERRKEKESRRGGRKGGVGGRPGEGRERERERERERVFHINPYILFNISIKFGNFL